MGGPRTVSHRVVPLIWRCSFVVRVRARIILFITSFPSCTYKTFVCLPDNQNCCWDRTSIVQTQPIRGPGIWIRTEKKRPRKSPDTRPRSIHVVADGLSYCGPKKILRRCRRDPLPYRLVQPDALGQVRGARYRHHHRSIKAPNEVFFCIQAVEMHPAATAPPICRTPRRVRNAEIVTKTERLRFRRGWSMFAT